MGHPGDPSHDHHRSIWFAHEKVLGINFWGDTTTARIRQKNGSATRTAPTKPSWPSSLGWYDGHDPKELLDTGADRGRAGPGPDGETFVELQATFRPTADSLEFGKTNFGFLAVRVAKHISAHFGGGTLTNSDGAVGEPAIFGKPAQVGGLLRPDAEGRKRGDHVLRPSDRTRRTPTKWHVREDGWMGASVCLDGPIATTKKTPLFSAICCTPTPDRFPPIARHCVGDFGERTQFEVVKANVRHQTWDVRRVG